MAEQATAMEWHGSIPSDLQGHAALSTFKNDAGGVGALAKSYVEAYKKLSEPVIERLDVKDSGTREKLYTKLGRPDKPEAYGLKDADLASHAHKAGLTQEQAKAVSDFLDSKGAADATKRAGEREAAKEALVTGTAAALKTEWGAKYDAESALMKKGLENDKFFSKDLRDKLTESGLIHHPDLARLANKLGHHAQEGGLLSGTGVPVQPSDVKSLTDARVKIQGEMNKYRQSVGKNFDPISPEWQSMLAARQTALTAESKAKADATLQSAQAR